MSESCADSGLGEDALVDWPDWESIDIGSGDHMRAVRVAAGAVVGAGAGGTCDLPNSGTPEELPTGPKPGAGSVNPVGCCWVG
jgi:hypothetical protein